MRGPTQDSAAEKEPSAARRRVLRLSQQLSRHPTSESILSACARRRWIRSRVGAARGPPCLAGAQVSRVEFVFRLSGGHISPILAASEEDGIRVIDVRHEVNAVFAADAVARLTGVPGVAAVTAGPA